MKRDNDLIRQILLDIEADDEWRYLDPAALSDDPESERSSYHLQLLCDVGWLTAVGKSENEFRLTNAGHDFIEATRDVGIWQRTKAAVAETGGNATLEIIKQIAVGFLKKQIKDLSGLDI